jgi:hypothetical protein
MRRITLLLLAVVILAGVIVFTAPPPLHADDSAAPLFVTTIPQGYRDWRLISVSHEAGSLNSIGAILGNDVAINAYREGKLPYPDGAIIAALHYSHTPSAENNKVFVHQVRRYGRLGVRDLRRRQARRCGVHEILLSLPQSGQG